jgi:type IV pilus assembly protein PilW
MVGYFGEPLAPVSITQDAGLAVGTDCGVAAQPNWIYGFTDAVTSENNSVTSVDNATGATANASFSCIQAGEIVANTDVVGIKRIAGNALPVAGLQPNVVYVRANGNLGIMYINPAAAPVAPPFNDWEYRPRIYYIRNFSNVAGDGIPSLCRKVLTWAAPPTMQTECIAQGIENLQVEYGLDLNGDGDVNRYLPNPTLTQMQQVISARVYLLARTLDEDFAYSDPRSYAVSNAPAYNPNDNFHRRLYQVTVRMPNRRNLLRLGI